MFKEYHTIGGFMKEQWFVPYRYKMVEKISIPPKNERLSILNEDDDELALIISQKNELLTQIEFIQKNINLKFFTKFPSDYPNKIKADAILSDIHNVMNKIVKIEDENSVNLQSVMNSIKVRLTEQDKNSKAISKYAVGNIKSHFIDTTK